LIDHPAETRRLQKWWYFIIKYDIPEKTVRELLLLEFDDQAAKAFQNLRYEFSRHYLYGLGGVDPKLAHDREMIRSKYATADNYKIFGKIIEKYAFCDGLVEILMKFKIPSTYSLESV